MPLDKEKIIANLSSATRKAGLQISCFDQLGSTNAWLISKAMKTQAHGHVCIADSQTAGVGRSGKQWIASDSRNILMSFAYRFEMELARLSSLSLVTGIGLVSALEDLGISGLQLKWPNDVYLSGAKLAGILIQTQPEENSDYLAVVGIGLNIDINDEDRKLIKQPLAELSSLGYESHDREMLIAKILDSLLINFRRFSQYGLSCFIDRWNELDCLRNRSVKLMQNDQAIVGKYQGINEHGALLMRLANNQLKEYHVGELSVRKAE